MTLRYIVGIRNAQLDAVTTQAGASALLRIYDGTQPATGGAPTNLLAELVCNATFAAAAAAGLLTVNAIASDTSANATGTATWWRIVKADGTTHVMDGTVSTSGADMNLNSTAVIVAGTVAITGFTITAGNP